MRKADEENALLKEQKDGEAAAPAATENGGASDQPSGEKAVFVTAGQDADSSSDAAPEEPSLFSPSDNMITDDDLAAQDELGDDFFATEDLEDEAPAPKTDEKTAPASAPKTDEKKSSGRLTLKGKGKS